MTIPKKVKIGIHEYEVRHVESIKGDDDTVTNKLGHISPDYLYIEISKQYPHNVQVETLLHEVCHGVMREMREEKLGKDEDFISRLAKQLYILLTENDLRKMMISEHTCHHCMKDFIEDDESIHESITFSCGVDRTGKRWKSVYKTIDDWYCDSDCRYMEAMLDCG